MFEFLIVVGVVLGMWAALKAPGDMERQGGTVDTPARRGGLILGTFVYMGFWGVIIVLGLLLVLAMAGAAI
jgi:hypothetical protein